MDSLHYLANYEIEQEIGQGSFATVFLGHEKTTKVKVAVKAVNTAKLNKKLAENLASEITILKEIDHPNIIKLYEIQKTENYIYLVMEYCEAGDLSQHLRKKRVIKEFEAQNLLQQLTSALKVLWENNLIHRDLKPQNLLLQNDTKNGLVLKIADFGFARYVEPSDLAETLCGSPLYMAPEILRYEKYDAKADLWSVGAIAYEMVFGSPPYRADNHVHLLRMIESADDSAIPFPSKLTFKQSLRRSSSAPSKFSKDKQSIVTINIETSDVFRDLLLKLLKKDPNQRIAFEDFFKHPFVAESFSRPSKIISKHASSHSLSFAPSVFSGSSLAESRRNSHSTVASFSSTVEEVLKLEDENSLLLEIFENLDRKPPLFMTIKNCLTLVLMIDKVISQESNQSMRISMSRLTEQRKTKGHSVLLLFYYNIDLLENCLEILKTAINRESEKGTKDFGDLLKASRAVSTKLDREYDLFDNIKATLILKSSASAGSISASSLSRSNSSQNITEEALSTRIELLLLQAAFKFAKEGGIQELLEQEEEARSKYLTAFFLLKSLVNPTELAPITSKYAQIQLQEMEQLYSYLNLIQDRLK